MEAREPNIKVKKSNEERESPVKESSKSDKLEVKGEQETVPEGYVAKKIVMPFLHTGII